MMFRIRLFDVLAANVSGTLISSVPFAASGVPSQGEENLPRTKRAIGNNPALLSHVKVPRSELRLQAELGGISIYTG
jgi:hypothetical protein